MKTFSRLATWIFIILVMPLLSEAQVESDSSRMVYIETIDGNEFNGSMIYEDSTRIELITGTLGKIQIYKKDIKRIKSLTPDKIVRGKVWFDNTQSSRYFWSPNGYGLKEGEGYYQNIWVFWNQASYGFSDYFSIGIGMIPLFLFGAGAGESTPVWIVPKFSIPVEKDKFNVGLGVLAGNIGLESDAGFGIAYGLATVGNRDNNFTFGMGYGYAAGNWARHPLITVSFMARTGPRGYFLSENFFISSGDGFLLLLSAGGRSFARRVGIDYGLFIPVVEDMDFFVALPWLGFTVPFESKKQRKQ